MVLDENLLCLSYIQIHIPSSFNEFHSITLNDFVWNEGIKNNTNNKEQQEEQNVP
jgi:hypothetical protein